MAQVSRVSTIPLRVAAVKSIYVYYIYIDLGSPSQVKSFQFQVAAEFANKSHDLSAFFGLYNNANAV